MFRPGMMIAALTLGALATPASATCTRPTHAPLPKAAVTLQSPSGKILHRTSLADGTLSLRGLKRGIWTAALLGETQSFTMHIGRDGKLQLRAEIRSYSCSPPGGPVHHAQIKSLTQLNGPKAQAKP